MSQPVVRIARRAFLKHVNLAAGGLMLGISTRAAGQKPTNEPAAAPGPKPRASAPQAQQKGGGLAPNAFVHVAPDGWVSIVCHRSEMGQGIRSSLPVLIADELGANMAQVRIVQGDGDKRYGDQNTDGSSSVRGVYDAMRLTGATARVMLTSVAAKRWGVKPQECIARDHRIEHPPTKRSFGFGELAAAAAKLPVPAAESVALRPSAELTHVGGPLPLIDGPAYVDGTAIYGADVRLPGMLTAVIARPPVVGGRVAKHDASAALKIPGVRKVVQLPDATPPYAFKPWGGLAVVADHTWAAMRGRAALQITWDHGKGAAYDSQRYREQLKQAVAKAGKPLRNRGDVDAGLASAARTVEAEYHVPHLPHLSMEPPAAVASFDGKRCEVWAPTQNPQAVQKEVARALGIAETDVVAHVTFLGGAFGRKSKADFCSEAALLSREMGAPVRVQWTRQDDVQHDYVNSVCTNRLSAGLDASGRVVAWRHRTAFPSIASLFGAPPQPGPNDLQQGVLDLALDVPNVRAESCDPGVAFTRIGWLRSVYNIFQAFSTGSFIDELAQARGKDPKDVWLEVLGPARKASLEELGIPALSNYGAPLDKHPVDVGRLRGVIERVTKAARWDERKGTGRALGLAAHRSFLSYTAVVASAVRKPSGKVCIDEVWAAFDAGMLINPDRVHAQIEGAVIFGMSLALYGGITMKDGAIEQSNFRGGGRIVRIGDAPRRIHVELVKSEALHGGAGEPGVPPVAPAIANAVFALTGTRVRDLPIANTLRV